MERIDQLENDILGIQDLIINIKNNKKYQDLIIGESQSLRDKEIIEFIGDNIKEWKILSDYSKNGKFLASLFKNLIVKNRPVKLNISIKIAFW